MTWPLFCACTYLPQLSHTCREVTWTQCLRQYDTSQKHAKWRNSGRSISIRQKYLLLQSHTDSDHGLLYPSGAFLPPTHLKLFHSTSIAHNRLGCAEIVHPCPHLYATLYSFFLLCFIVHSWNSGPPSWHSATKGGTLLCEGENRTKL